MSDFIEMGKKRIISIIGLGYVGLAAALGFGLKGHKIIGIDSDQEKIRLINRKTMPIYERGMLETLASTEISATTDYKQILSSEITFICVDTPSDEDGVIFLGNIEKSTEQMADILQEKRDYHLVVIKSTVVPMTTEEIIIPIMEAKAGVRGRDWGVCVNPEFLREGRALEDFLHPDRIIIGEGDRKSGDLLQELYSDFEAPILRTDLKTAEMIKYASNAFLATKISFINEIGNLCKKMNIDVYQVAGGMGYDKRIGRKFLNAGIGFGGSCLPKDSKALIAKAKELGYQPKLLEAMLGLNQGQPLRAIGLLRKHMPQLRGRDVGILGLSFKPDTDDVRNSPAITIAGALLKEGANIKAYDPKAMSNFARFYPQVCYTTPREVLNCEAIFIVTEWDEFKGLNYKGKIVIDGRGIEKAREASIYEGICW